MTSIEEFLHMGGYAFYVWTSYGVAAVVLIANAVAPMFARRELERRVARQDRQSRRKS
jgi:heme exporter protein D